MAVRGEFDAAVQARMPAFRDAGMQEFDDLRRPAVFGRLLERYPAGVTIPDLAVGTARRIIVVSGWLCEFRMLRDGRRQIFSFLLPGDAVSIRTLAGGASRGLLTVTHTEITETPALGPDADPDAIIESIQDHEERLFDHMVRIGRLTAKERVLNLLLEFHDRLDAIGLVKDGAFRLPLTQEMIADALGLSIVHINRTLQELRRESMIMVRRGVVSLHQPDKLAFLASYQPRRRPSTPGEAPLLA